MPDEPALEPRSAARRWWWSRSETPATVYAAIFLTMAVLWVVQELHPDLTLGMFTELLGAAFTLFIIDTLLVRAKTKRWNMVQEHMDYLIGRNVNRLREGLAARAFGFEADIGPGAPEEQAASVRAQRAELLSKMERQEDLVPYLAPSLFTADAQAYFDGKADELWDLLNMKYAEFLAPTLVSSLMRLHTHVKDLCSHLNQYARAERHPEDAGYYTRIGRLGASHSMSEVLRVVNELKQRGYSEPAALA